MTTLEELRQKHAKFIYESYSWKIVNDNLEISFQYKIESDLLFSPTLTVLNVSQEMVDSLGKEKLDSYVFNIGLAEMFSYWKAVAPQVIEINAGKLDQEQARWWHKLLIKGMGEYFFVNKIEFTAKDFVKIVSNSDKTHLDSSGDTSNSIASNNGHNPDKIEKILIPVGGGKDSSVTLEILGNLRENQAENPDSNQTSSAGVFVVNPTQASLDVIQAFSDSTQTEKIEIKRVIDPKLLELNDQGYLNGHVPISALFAFLSVFVADLFEYSHVAISNERSSNEGNVQFCDREINHQYSKTYEFEQDFQNYVKKYLPEGAPLYFSFLRPLYELQIAKIFAGNLPEKPGRVKPSEDRSSETTPSNPTPDMRKHHHIFRSCNRGQKTNSWCGECSKCLFAYVILYPFLGEEVQTHFGKDLFKDEKLWPIAQELLGFSEKKPLECVGTHEETIAAFYLSINKYLDRDQNLPVLLKKVAQEIIRKEENLANRTEAILNSWNEENSIPVELAKILKKYV